VVSLFVEQLINRIGCEPFSEMGRSNSKHMFRGTLKRRIPETACFVIWNLTAASRNRTSPTQNSNDALNQECQLMALLEQNLDALNYDNSTL